MRCCCQRTVSGPWHLSHSKSSPRRMETRSPRQAARSQLAAARRRPSASQRHCPEIKETHCQGLLQCLSVSPQPSGRCLASPVKHQSAMAFPPIPTGLCGTWNRPLQLETASTRKPYRPRAAATPRNSLEINAARLLPRPSLRPRRPAGSPGYLEPHERLMTGRPSAGSRPSELPSPASPRHRRHREVPHTCRARPELPDGPRQPC